MPHTFTPASAIAARLHARLPKAAFPPLSPVYLHEPRGRYQGQGGLLIAPATVDEVATVIAACCAARVAVVPYGGGTGLVGGQIMGPPTAAQTAQPVILSLERMSAVRSICPQSDVAIVEAGVILHDLQTAARAVGRLFPLSLASEGSARIGGVLATNAGGVTVLRHGSARDLCLGLEAVLPDGAIHHGLRPLRKDNAGYDLRHLLIGAEGTLGVITAAALKLVAVPAAQAAGVVVVPGPEAALDLLALARETLGETISAFELISGTGVRFLQEVGPKVRLPFASVPDWMVLIDVGLPAVCADPDEALNPLFERALAKGLVHEGVLGQSARHRADLWAMRAAIPEANRRIGSVSSHDISVPLKAIPAFIARAPRVVGRIGAFRINCFGHVGDGNLHWNVFPQPGRTRADHEHQRAAIKRAVHDLVHDLGGSIAAEHGIGRLKVADLERYCDPAGHAAMRAIKGALDPRAIMNPGAVLRLNG